ncbi:MAG: serpin family protein [Actinomycetes bacterium]
MSIDHVRLAARVGMRAQARRAGSLVICGALVLAGASACSGQADSPPVTPGPTTSGSSDQVRLIEAALTNSTTNEADVAAVSASLRSFASKLFQQISKEQATAANVFISPASVEQVLLLLLAATDGTVRQQLRDVLNLTLPDDRLFPAVTALWKHQMDSGYTLDIANSAVVRDGEPTRLNPDYVRLVSEHLGAQFRNDSFADPAALANGINAQISEQTKGMIDNLVTSDMLSDPNLFLVLVNAVYFKGDWAKPFSDYTTDGTFTTANGTTKTVPMMSHDGITTYASGDGYTAVELPYAGGASMLLVLPDQGRFAEISGSLTAARLSQIRTQVRAAHPAEAGLLLPKFSLKAQPTTNLIPAITTLGAPALFAPTHDWKPLLANPTNDPLQVGFFVHKAAIEVDEQGTEAAAGSAAGDIATAVPRPRAVITFNRPFILTIEDNGSDSVLFMGRIGDPGQ